jgi:hypothetical protein
VNKDGPRAAIARLDAGEIVASVGEALYVWDIASDALTWSINAGEILAIADTGAIAAALFWSHRCHWSFSCSSWRAARRRSARCTSLHVGLATLPCAKQSVDDVDHSLAGPRASALDCDWRASAQEPDWWRRGLVRQVVMLHKLFEDVAERVRCANEAAECAGRTAYAKVRSNYLELERR